MEDLNNRISEIGDETNHGEAPHEKPSRTFNDDTSSANVKCERDSSQDSQTKPILGNSSQTVDIVEISSDDELQIVEVNKTESVKKAMGDEIDQNPSSSTSGRTSPKDVTCSVCLSEYENKAFLDRCFHAFCYFCILQWSEIVRTCPLCKSSFTSIIHSVKSMDNYQQHYLSKPEVNAPAIQHQSQGDGRRFRYRTTLADGSRHRQQTQRRQQGVNDAWGQREQRRQAHLSLQRNRGMIAREQRRTIYSSNLWVQGVTQTGRPRHREISPAFFRANPACSHRLIPWLTRDLRVLLNDEESHVNFLLQIILSLITKVELTSEDFCNHLRPFLFDKTEHFIHEFISFACSPFDVSAYDERAQYSWPNESRDQVRDTPTVFNSSSAGWQTPAPGPSGVSLIDLSEMDWNRDSPALQIDVTNWSPDSSPGPAGHCEPSTMGNVTISSSHSSQTVSVEHLESDELSNGSSVFKVDRKRRVSVTETTSEEETPGKSRKKHSKHKHRHKHKCKHNRKDSSRYNVSRRSDSPERNSNMPGPSGRVSVDSSIIESPVDVIVVSDDSVALDVFEGHSKSGSIDFSSCRGRRKRDLSSSLRSRSRSASKGKRNLRCSYRHRSRSKSRDKKETSPRGQRSSSKYSESYSRREYSGSRKTGKAHCRSRSRESASHSRGRSKERLKRGKRSRSRSRQSDSGSQERHRSKLEGRFRDDNQDSSTEHFKTSDLKKRQHTREKKRSHSRSSSRSQSRSKGKSAVETRTTNSRTWRKSNRSPRLRSSSPVPKWHESASFSYSRNSRSRSPRGDSRSRSRYQLSLSSPRNHTDGMLPKRHESASSSFLRDSRSRSPRRDSRSRSRYRLSLSSSQNHTDTSRDSRSPSRKAIESKTSSAASESCESTDQSNEDIRKEIEDLELRITADKKRLLKLLIKQERTKGDGDEGDEDHLSP